MAGLAHQAARPGRRRWLVRIVARGALERPRCGARGEKARTLAQPICMRDDVDAAGLFEERPLVAKRLRRQVAELVLPFPQYRDGRVHVALLAYVHASRERQTRRVHDRVVIGAIGLRARRPFLHMKRSGTVTALAPY